MQQTVPKAKEGIISSDTVLIHDQWMYRWQGTPPRGFCLHKVIFHPWALAEIAVRGWQVLEPAVAELVSCFHMENEATKIDWLKLDSVNSQKCLIGVHTDETVVAAAPVSSLRYHFIPYRYYDLLANEKQWQQLQCYGSYRHLIAEFNNGFSFYSEGCGKLCELWFYAHFGIHGVHSLFAKVKIGERIFAIPSRIRLSDSLADLPGKVYRITQFAQDFVYRLGSQWLCLEDEEQLWAMAVSYLKGLATPAYRINELKGDSELRSCHTKLDMLLFLSKVFSGDTISSSPGLLKLSKLFS